MPLRRLEELRKRYALAPAAVERLQRLLEVLACSPQAPTTVTDPLRAVDVHVADSLSGLEVPALIGAHRVADLGSGAGFPALVLAAVLPQSTVTAVESVNRKCDFIAETAAALRLDNLSVVCSRAEDWKGGLGVNDVVVVRAVAPLGVLCEYAAPLLAAGGTLVAWKGRMEEDEIEVAGRAADQLGLTRPVLQPVRPFPTSQHRQLALAVKRSPTPDRFPRRTGVALKRQLGVNARSAA